MVCGHIIFFPLNTYSVDSTYNICPSDSMSTNWNLTSYVTSYKCRRLKMNERLIGACTSSKQTHTFQKKKSSKQANKQILMEWWTVLFVNSAKMYDFQIYAIRWIIRGIKSSHRIMLSRFFIFDYRKIRSCLPWAYGIITTSNRIELNSKFVYVSFLK